jgi:gamma-glutamylcyclotransferase (GGCT)/AIG2-like uncharacterized protein YtfP
MNGIDMYEDMDWFDEVFGDLDLTMLHSGEKHLVFVYGTLMKGMRNHHRLKRDGVRLISDNAETVAPSGVMLRSRITQSGYRAPILVSCKYNAQALGEVYEISNTTLLDLDAVEGHPYVYHREKMEVIWEGNGSRDQGSIWIYRYVGKHVHDTTGIKVHHSFHDGAVLYKWTGEEE